MCCNLCSSHSQRFIGLLRWLKAQGYKTTMPRAEQTNVIRFKTFYILVQPLGFGTSSGLVGYCLVTLFSCLWNTYYLESGI
jgi:hypothetical protein